VKKAPFGAFGFFIHYYGNQIGAKVKRCRDLFEEKGIKKFIENIKIV